MANPKHMGHVHDHSSIKHNPDHTMDHDSSMHSMQMFFVAECHCTILFKSWVTHTCLSMFGSCIAVILASFLFEGLRFLRSKINQKARKKVISLSSQSPPPSSSSSSTRNNMDNGDGVLFATQENVCCKRISSPKKFSFLIHLLQTFLYIVQMALGYLIMLIAMTFNVWLFISILIGAGLGYFFFTFFKKTPDHGESGLHLIGDDGVKGDSHCHCG